ncbi:MAG: tetratricopeptide repeat protein [Gammaproteobacteria bacterium]|nr:tetratricopeptide repeat protein [Gammaproteobacteria bacterium]
MSHLMQCFALVCGLIYSSSIFAADRGNQQTHHPDAAAQVQLSEDLSTDRQRSLVEYQALVSQLESEQGAYANQLGEALLGMGLIYRSQGNHQLALDAFKRALQISRINEGLHNLNQIKILELIIESNTAQQAWHDLGENYHYLYWVNRRNYADDDARLLPIIERIGLWHVDAYHLNIYGSSVGHLVKADDLFDKAIDIAANIDSGDYEQLVRSLYYTALINYHIASDINDKFKTSHWDIREAMIPNQRPTPYVNEIAVRQFYFNQSYFKGKRAIQRILDIHAGNHPASVIEHAQALVFFGDYFLALRRKWDAMKRYEQAYNLLVDNGASIEDINKLFGEPVPLKTLTPPGGDELNIGQNNTYVDAVFDVPSNGWPSNIKITETNPQDNPDMFKRGKLAIAGTHYRPRFEGGKPVPTSGVKLRYVFKQ